MNISNRTLHIVKFSLDLILCFWRPIFLDFQNETAGLWVNKSINKGAK